MPGKEMNLVKEKEEDLSTPPDNCVVWVKTRILNVSEVSAKNSNATFDIRCNFFWYDSRLTDPTKPSYLQPKMLGEPWNLDSVWQADVAIENRDEMEATVEGTWFVDNTKGLMQKTVRFRGTIKHAQDLHRYPFDETSVLIRLESQLYPMNQVELKLVDASSVECAEPTYAKERGQPLLTGNDFVPPVEWEFVGTSTEATTFQYNTVYSRIVLSLHLRRRSHYYFYKVLLPLFMVGGLTLTAFVVPREDVADRLSILLTTFLSTAAFLYVMDDDLPKCGYLTDLDQCITGNLVLISLMTLFVCMSKYFSTVPDWDEWAVQNQFEYSCFMLFSLFFVGLNLFVFRPRSVSVMRSLWLAPCAVLLGIVVFMYQSTFR